MSKFPPSFWAKVWFRVLREAGPRIAWRSLSNHFEDRLASHGQRTVMRVMRGWYLSGAIAGLAILATAPRPRMLPDAGVDAASMVLFGALAGAGTALALRSTAMLASTFSPNLLVQRFGVSLKAPLLRTAAVSVIAMLVWGLPWPISGWSALCLALVAWANWPLVQRLAIAVQSPRYLTHRMGSVDQLLAMHARKLAPAARAQIAQHEAGHVVFFGLGRTVPEDLFAYMEDELPELERLQDGQSRAAGAVSSMTSLSGKAITLDLHREEQLAMLGMFCGGAAAEIVHHGQPSASIAQDVGVFEAHARLFLSLYPDPNFPLFVQPQGELEVRANAASLAAFRLDVTSRAAEFLRANQPTAEAVTRALLEKGELDVEDLRRLLVDVQPAAGFQRFSWPADIPARDYLR